MGNEAEERTIEAARDHLRKESDKMFEEMQTPESKAAVDRVFRADPKDYGRIITEAAQKDSTGSE